MLIMAFQSLSLYSLPEFPLFCQIMLSYAKFNTLEKFRILQNLKMFANTMSTFYPQSGFFFGDADLIGCIPCECDTSGTVGSSGDCDTDDGQCNCLEDPSVFFIDSRRCEPCDLYQFALNGKCTGKGTGYVDLCQMISAQLRFER